MPRSPSWRSRLLPAANRPENNSADSCLVYQRNGADPLPIPAIFSLSTPMGEDRGEGSATPPLTSRFRMTDRHGTPATDTTTISAREAAIGLYVAAEKAPSPNV